MMKTLELKHLKPYVMPKNYFGETYEEYYVFLGQNRDSDSITRSNFEVARERLEGIETENNDEYGWIISRQSHWACGWLEIIYIHQRAKHELIQAAEEMLEDLKNYPVLNDDHWSELQYDERNEYWKYLSIKHRVEYIQEYNERETGKYAQPISIFAARHNYVPSNSGALDETLDG